MSDFKLLGKTLVNGIKILTDASTVTQDACRNWHNYWALNVT